MSTKIDVPFALGDLVCLRDLTDATNLNGRLGKVAQCLQDGHVVVRLFGDSDDVCEELQEVSVKPGNLEKIYLPYKQSENLTIREVFAVSCVNCSKVSKREKTLECSRCLVTAYCSTKCQRQHWKKAHKNECEDLRKARKLQQVPSNRSPMDRAWILAKLSERLNVKGDDVAGEKLVRAGINDLLPDHEFYQLYSALAIHLRGQGKIDEAVNATRNALRVMSTDRKTKGQDRSKNEFFGRHTLASLLQDQGDYHQAIRNYKKVWELDQSSAYPLFSIGQMEFLLGNDNKAETYFCQFLEKEGPFNDPKAEHAETAVVAYCQLAIILRNRNRELREVCEQRSLALPVELYRKRIQECIALYQKAIHLTQKPEQEEVLKRRLGIVVREGCEHMS